MTISYPVTLPTTPAPRRIVPRQRSVVGMTESPFTGEQQVFAHQGGGWEWDVEMPPMQREAFEPFIAALLSLNGREGTALFGLTTSPRGTWTSAVHVDGSGQTGRTLLVQAFAAGVTGKAGDWFSLGSGGATQLHKLTADFTSDVTGAATLDIWPRLRASPTNGDAVTVINPKGIWRLAGDGQEWSHEIAQWFGFSFSLIEAY